MARATLYGPNGKPLASSAWDASSHARRARHWRPSTAHINALAAFELDTVRVRANDELRRNPWAKKALEAFTANVIGTGIRPKVNADSDALEREIMDAFEEWLEECDADGTSDYYGLQALVCRTFSKGGDCFTRFRPRRPEDGLSVPLQLQLLAAEMCDPWKNEARADGTLIKAGIEFNGFGQRRAYWMFRSHPGELVRPIANGMQSVPVPADQILHTFQVLEPGQVRGVPGLATVLGLLHEIREVDDASLARAKIQNLYATFETIPASDATSALDDGEEATDEDDVPEVTAEGGSHVLLPPGHDVKFSTPPAGDWQYEGWIRTKLRAAAAGSNVTYEQITCDGSQLNFSSIRAMVNQLRRELEQIQRNVMVHQWCRPGWVEWFEYAVLSGRIQLPRGVKLRTLLRALWQPPGWEYVEPEKDVKAAVARVRAGISSRTRECAKLGIDIEQLDREIAAERAREALLELVFDSNPSSDQDGAARAAALGPSEKADEKTGDGTGGGQQEKEAA